MSCMFKSSTLFSLFYCAMLAAAILIWCLGRANTISWSSPPPCRLWASVCWICSKFPWAEGSLSSVSNLYSAWCCRGWWDQSGSVDEEIITFSLHISIYVDELTWYSCFKAMNSAAMIPMFAWIIFCMAVLLFSLFVVMLLCCNCNVCRLVSLQQAKIMAQFCICMQKVRFLFGYMRYFCSGVCYNTIYTVFSWCYEWEK